MTHDFFDQPILNSPYDYPHKHWELDQHGQPTFEVIDHLQLESSGSISSRTVELVIKS